MELLPIGSVVQGKKLKFCIIGYSDINTDNGNVWGYYAVPCPTGFYNSTSIVFIPFDKEMKVVYDGYKTKESKAASDFISVIKDNLGDIANEQLVGELKRFKEEIDRKEKQL